MEQPDTPPQTGNKNLDNHNKKLHRQTINRITDEFIILPNGPRSQGKATDSGAEARDGGTTQGGGREAHEGKGGGLIAGIIATPQDQDLLIRLDNQAVVKQFREVVVNRKRASVGAKPRFNCAAEWAVVARICSERTGSTTVEWIKGHSGNEWKRKADMAAKEAQSQGGTTWKVDRAAQDDIKYSATMAGVILDQDTRRVLKIQAARRWHQEWRTLRETKRSIQD
ncbi:hypothetical protein KI688_012124 [Linnemannia hyalina]|uniref:RNase H type-1 domain-containing protein n=1 Tax=Linnemannia hyalina TaxID=64524 RepID=A0A9P7XUF2_9FUNG|nr:hypothetical protein KI688_012124 [Linnemannia hyalina]